MITYTHPAAGKLPIKTLVAKQWPTNIVIVQTTIVFMQQLVVLLVTPDDFIARLSLMRV